LISLSFSAQILVAPLTIFYFHKFPIYFWLSGLIAVPSAYIILVLGIIMIILEFVAPQFNTIIDPIVTSVFDVFIWSIKFIENLPFSTVEQIWLSSLELILLYISLILFLAGKHVAKANYIIASLVILLLFMFSRYQYNTSRNQQASVTIYDNYKGHIIDIFTGKTCYSLYSDNLAERTIEFVTGNNRINKKAESIITLNHQNNYQNERLIKTKNLIQFENESILLLDSNYIETNIITYVNTAIILGDIKSKMDSIRKYIHADQWIITQTEKQYKQKKWLEWCNQNNEDCISIKEEGAYTIDLRKKSKNESAEIKKTNPFSF